jgi:hypothetical protein
MPQDWISRPQVRLTYSLIYFDRDLYRNPQGPMPSIAAGPHENSQSWTHPTRHTAVAMPHAVGLAQKLPSSHHTETLLQKKQKGHYSRRTQTQGPQCRHKHTQ